MNGEESNPDVAPRNVFSLHHRPSPVLVRHVYATFSNKFSEHSHQNKFLHPIRYISRSKIIILCDTAKQIAAKWQSHGNDGKMKLEKIKN